MPVSLGPDGKPVETKTSYNPAPEATQPPAGNEAPTQPPGGAAGGSPFAGGSEQPTQAPQQSDSNSLFGAVGTSGEVRVEQDLEGKTSPPGGWQNVETDDEPAPETVPGPGGNQAGNSAPVNAEPVTQYGGATSSSASVAPPPVSGDDRTVYVPASPETLFPENAELSVGEYVCGFLVVIEGPGKGRSIPVRPGQSIAARNPQVGIPLMFGDNGITGSKTQFTITYAKNKNMFYINAGDGVSENYLNDDILLAPAQLKSGDVIECSKTKLRFVAFCDEGFSWE